MHKILQFLCCVSLFFLSACSSSEFKNDDAIEKVIINGEQQTSSTQPVEDVKSLPIALSDYEQKAFPYIDWWQEFSPYSLNEYSHLTAHNIKMAIDWEYLYVPLPYGELYALEMETGDEIWSVKFSNPINTGAAVDNGIVYVGLLEGEVIALDSLTGKELWRKRLNSSVNAISPQPSGIYARDVEGNVYKINPKNGSDIWQEKDFIPKLTIVGPSLPLERGAFVVYGDDNGHVIFRNKDDAHLIKRIVVGGSRGYSELDNILDVQPELIKNNVFYTAAWKSQLAAIDLESQNLLWLRKEGNFKSIQSHENLLLVQKENGNIEGMLPRSGKTIWQKTYSNRPSSTIVKHGNWWVISDNQGVMHWFDGEDGNAVARFRDEIAWGIQAASVDDQIFILNQLGQLIKFKINP